MLELFHRLTEPASARARALVVGLGLLHRVRLRNVHFDSHAQDLRARGGDETPALWDGTRLVAGEAAVAGALRRAAAR